MSKKAEARPAKTAFTVYSPFCQPNGWNISIIASQRRGTNPPKPPSTLPSTPHYCHRHHWFESCQWCIQERRSCSPLNFIYEREYSSLRKKEVEFKGQRNWCRTAFDGAYCSMSPELWSILGSFYLFEILHSVWFWNLISSFVQSGIFDTKWAPNCVMHYFVFEVASHH